MTRQATFCRIFGLKVLNSHQHCKNLLLRGFSYKDSRDNHFNFWEIKYILKFAHLS